MSNEKLFQCRVCGHARNLHSDPWCGVPAGCLGLQWKPSRTDGRMTHEACTCTEKPWEVKS